MARERSGEDDLQSLLQEIKSSDVVECRIQLLTRLASADIVDQSNLISFAECLTYSIVGTLTTDLTLWEDVTCLDVSQCMLHKAIVHVAAKCIDPNTSGCLRHFLILGTKASTWCGKHLKMTLLSNGDSQEEEEHSILFFELLLDLLRFSTLCITNLTNYSLSNDGTLMGILEGFILGQLSLAKDSVAEAKGITSFGSEIFEAAQLVLDAVTELCRVYSQHVNWEVCELKTESDSVAINNSQVDGRNHVISIIRCTLEKLCELGIFAANSGGSLVTILNMSWKGVVTLLQLGKGALAGKVNVSKIILTLISLATESLRCAAEVWLSSLKEPVSSAEIKRALVPTKFYLINAVRISLLYPHEAVSLYRDITLCVLKISTLAIFLSKETLLTAASEAVSEVLEPTSFILLKSILNSAQVKQELKFKILDWLFIHEKDSSATQGEISCDKRMVTMDAIFSVSSEAMQRTRVLLLGRVAYFLYILKSSSELEEDMRFRLTGKLKWFFNNLVDEEVYSLVLALQIPVLYGTGKSHEIVWQPMFSWILHALKSFMIVICSSPAWEEMLSFLHDNCFHPHFLCHEIVMELWCFMARYVEVDVENEIIDKLSLLLKLVTTSESVLRPGSACRAVARLVCMFLTQGSQSTVNRVYGLIFSDERTLAYVALLMEGFPLKLLTDNLKRKATERIFADYLRFIESFDENLMRSCSFALCVAPVFVLSATLSSLQVSSSEIDIKTLKFLVSVLHNYNNSMDEQMREYYCKLLGETLVIISNTKHLYAFDEMEEVILELRKLFISGQEVLDPKLHPRKSDLAFFMAGLVHMEIVESDACVKSSAVWDLYHMLLRERHWALVHLAITAFGYFAARTSCSELWRFVPLNAALSFDLDSGDEVKEDKFMLEFKMFLEKEKALRTATSSSEELGLLMKEGLILKKMVQRIQNSNIMACKAMEIDGENQASKRRKLPDGISKGMELLQSGLKVFGDGLYQWQQHSLDSTGLRDKFFTQFSLLGDMIDNMVGLAGSG